MFVVLFEVEPRAEQWENYLATARLLRPELEAIDGFIDNERFRGAPEGRRVLSLSTWRDEKALVRWRTQATHHTMGQHQGRSAIFADYRLRVCEVTFDTALPPEALLPQLRFDATVVGSGKVVSIHEMRGDLARPDCPGDRVLGSLEASSYTHLNDPHWRLWLHTWSDEAVAAAADTGGATRVRRARIIREYGMRDRREAPQYFPDADL